MQDISPASLLALAVVMMNLCTILVALRLVGRRMQRLSFGKDDIFIVFSWVFFVAMCINMITAVAYGRWGVPLKPLIAAKWRPEGREVHPQLVQSLQFVFVHELLLPVQLMFAKLSLIFFYRRLLCPERFGFLHRATLATAIVVSVWGVAMFLTYLFQCGVPVSNYWSPSLAVQNACSAPIIIEPFMAASDCLLDVVVFILPIRRLITLRISSRKKILLSVVFATGVLSVAASVVRLYIYAAPLDPSNTSFTTVNRNILISIAMFWGIFEASFAIIAACLPSTKFFIDLVKAKATGDNEFWSYTKGSGSGKSSRASPVGTPRSGSDASLPFKDSEHGSTVTLITAEK